MMDARPPDSGRGEAGAWARMFRHAEDDVSKLRLRISVSLDGFVAGPRQSVEDPLGVDGMHLHEWAFPLAVWRRLHG
jgi:hypothetical protein